VHFMSNQFGLILSFLFLTIFISFSNEMINYQSFSTIFDAQTTQIFNYVQKNGYNETIIQEYCIQYQFNNVKHQSSVDNLFEHHTIIFTKNYRSISSFENIFNKTITKKLEIFRKVGI